MAKLMKRLSVNIDHIATLRQARQAQVPDPVQAAVLAELGGADGITVHLRQDRRHINERDVSLLKATIKTELNIELAAAPAMIQIATKVKPAQVTLVPETPDELTTEGGLDLVRNFERLAATVKTLKRSGIRVSAFIEADPAQIEAAAKLGCDLIEINTDRYSRSSLAEGQLANDELMKIAEASEQAAKLCLQVHAGHGIDYRNIVPLLGISQIEGFSIGFSIIARSVFTGLREATSEMKRIMEVHR